MRAGVTTRLETLDGLDEFPTTAELTARTRRLAFWYDDEGGSVWWHAVEAGKVRLVGQFGTYGLTVVLEHGNGYYSVYSHLLAAAVKLGATITKGAQVGTVGGENSDYGPHLHFEIRGDNQVALDPTAWLRKR